MVLSLHSAKNPDDTELEDTLHSVVNNMYHSVCVCLCVCLCVRVHACVSVCVQVTISIDWVGLLYSCLRKAFTDLALAPFCFHVLIA